MARGALRRASARALTGKTEPMSTRDVELVRGAWEAFARGDVEAATSILDPEVRWYPASEPDGPGACRDRDEARAFIHRALADGASTELLDVRDAGENRLVVV